MHVDVNLHHFDLKSVSSDGREYLDALSKISWHTVDVVLQA
jgi:hypothetical protein